MAPKGQGRARMLANLGTLSWKNGAKRQAAAYLRRALSEMEAAVGPQHPDIVHILDDYALVLKKTGLKPESEGIAKRAAEMRGREDSPGRRVDGSQ